MSPSIICGDTWWSCIIPLPNATRHLHLPTKYSLLRSGGKHFVRTSIAQSTAPAHRSLEDNCVAGISKQATSTYTQVIQPFAGCGATYVGSVPSADCTERCRRCSVRIVAFLCVFQVSDQQRSATVNVVGRYAAAPAAMPLLLLLSLYISCCEICCTGLLHEIRA